MEEKYIDNRKLRVWWIPQIPMNPFYVNVDNLKEAVLIINTLSDYDEFQYENNIKPDYSNVGGLQVFCDIEKEWVDWYLETDENIYDCFDDYRNELMF